MVKYARTTRLAFTCCAALFAVPATAAETAAGLGASALFDIAEASKGEGHLDDAEIIYRALAKDPDGEVRAEARFRLGMLLSHRKRYRDAAVALRALLDEKPEAARVRIELAQILALMGDERRAREQLRQAQATGLPPDVALAVDQFAGALRSRKALGGSLEIALAPDSNINRATAARTLDTVIAPLDLSRDARSRSGIGLKIKSQAYARVRLSPRFSLFPRVSSRAELYDAGRFNDVSVSALAGVEWLATAGDRLQPAVGITQRFYGGDRYASTKTGTVNWLHMAGPRAQIETEITVSGVRHRTNRLQDGNVTGVSLSYERAFSAKSGGTLAISGTRQTARDPGYATKSAGLNAVYWYDFGRVTVFASVAGRLLESDSRLFPFLTKRNDRLIRASAGATFRQIVVLGFSPVVRASFERNRSTVGIYDYRRTAVEFGVNRAF